MRKVPLLILLVLLISCNKKYHVIGRVYNPITGEGLANVKVEFFRSTVGEIPAGNEEITSTLTDASGYYDLSYKGRAENIKLELDGSLYELGNFYNGSYQTVRGLEAKKTQEIDWHAVPYGNYRLEVNNINCQGPNDSIIIREQNEIESLLNIEWSIVGCGGYNTSTDKTPMGWRYIYWTVIRNSVSTTFSDSIHIGEGQNIVYTLNY